MWPLGELLAAEAPANDSLIVVVGGIIVAAIGALGLVITEIVKGRDARPTPALPPSTVTVRACSSTSMRRGRRCRESSVPSVSVRSVNEWREPSTRTRPAPATTSCTSSTLRGAAQPGAR